MDEKTSEKLRKVAEQFGSSQNPNPPMRVDWMFSVAWALFVNWSKESHGNVALVKLLNGEIGIATRNVKGYTPTPAYVYQDVDADSAVDWFNQNILDLSDEEAMKIVASSM